MSERCNQCHKTYVGFGYFAYEKYCMSCSKKNDFKLDAMIFGLKLAAVIFILSVLVAGYLYWGWQGVLVVTVALAITRAVIWILTNAPM